MDLATIEPAIQDWIAKLTDIARPLVVWENQPRPASQTGTIATLSWVSSTGWGTDERRDEVDLHGNLVPLIVGQRAMTFQVTIETHDQRPGYTARNYLERARDRFWWPSGQAILAAVNVSFISSPGVRTLDAPRGQRMMSLAALEIKFGATVVTRDVDGGSSTIEHALVTSHLEQGGTELPAGLQLHNARIPTP